MSSDALLFVYGTLRRQANQPMHRAITTGATFLGNGTFRGKLYDLGRYPGVTPSRLGRDKVIGDVYRLKDASETFKVLDDYEGKLFVRQSRRVDLNDGRKLSAWIYLYCGPMKSAKRIRSGNYLTFLENGQLFAPRGTNRD